MVFFEYLCSTFLFLIDIFCGLIIPIYETMFYLRYYRLKKKYIQKLTHWTTYWIFYSVLHLIHRLLYFFPFSYEIRVLAILLMAHPEVEAASIIYNFLVTNPLIMIKLIDLRNRLREKLDREILPKMKNFRLWD